MNDKPENFEEWYAKEWAEYSGTITPKSMMKIAFKAGNDLAKPNGEPKVGGVAGYAEKMGLKTDFVDDAIYEPCQNDQCPMFDKNAVMGINCMDGLNFPCRLHSADLAKPSEVYDRIQGYIRVIQEKDALIADLAKPSEWVSVVDRLPDIDVDVLITDGTSIDKGYLSTVGFYEHDQPDYPSFTDENITHWQPLPSPPTREIP